MGHSFVLLPRTHRCRAHIERFSEHWLRELEPRAEHGDTAFIRNGAPDLSERELIDAAEVGKRAYRQGRYGKSRGASDR